MMLTYRDRLSLAQGLTVRGSAVRHGAGSAGRAPSDPQDVQRFELPMPRPGQRLVELERARGLAERPTI
jgi:hypothetical protein